MAKDIWVISDTHFSHHNIIHYCDRPFKNINEMDEHIIEKWNSVVKDGDKVYHLGDVYFGGNRKDATSYFDWLFSRLKGQKRLILGNHDNGKDQHLQRYFKKIDVWRMFPEFGLLLSHVPVWSGSLSNGKDRALINVHGHTHNNPNQPLGPYTNVCVENIDYTPVNIEELRVK